MKPIRDLAHRLSPFLGLLFLYLFLAGVVLVATGQFFSDALSETPSGDQGLFLFLLILPVPLIGALVLQFFQLRRDYTTGRAGSKLKYRLTLTFLLIAFLAAMPQGALAVSLIRSALHTWLGADLGRSLESGLETALDYHHDLSSSLQNLVSDSYFHRNYSDISPSTLRSLWKEAQERVPKLTAFQVFTQEGQELVNFGPPDHRIEYNRVQGFTSGLLPKQVSPSATLLRASRNYSQGGTGFILVFTLSLPAQFDQRSEDMTRSLQVFKRLESYSKSFYFPLIVALVLFSLPLLFTTSLLALSLSEELTRPLINLEKATRLVAGGDYSIRILTPGYDEMGSLVQAFNTMVKEIATSRSHLAQTEKISTWKDIAQQLAHELRNPLTPIRLSTERLVKKYKDQGLEAVGEVLEGAAEAILGEVKKLDVLLREFSDFARLPAPVKQRLDLTPLIDQLISTFRHSDPGVDIRWAQTGQTVWVSADPAQLEGILTNLVKNAAEAMNHQGQVFLSCSTVKKNDEYFQRIRVQDNGPGIPEDLRHKIFNPYFTTKSEGTGLGLSIVERIVYDHKGFLWYESQPGAGTTFFIDLPGGTS